MRNVQWGPKYWVSTLHLMSRGGNWQVWWLTGWCCCWSPRFCLLMDGWYRRSERLALSLGLQTQFSYYRIICTIYEMYNVWDDISQQQKWDDVKATVTVTQTTPHIYIRIIYMTLSSYKSLYTDWGYRVSTILHYPVLVLVLIPIFQSVHVRTECFQWFTSIRKAVTAFASALASYSVLSRCLELSISCFLSPSTNQILKA